MRGRYIRLDLRSPKSRIYDLRLSEDRFTFVDIQASPGWTGDLVINALRDADFGLRPYDGTVLFRHAEPLAASVDDQLVDGFTEALNDHALVPRDLQAGVLVQKIGAKPTVRWRTEVEGDAEPHILSARATEIAALAHWGGAIWKPKGHHFQLPSGRHDGVFIKAADLMKSDRDAETLASWLLPTLDSTTAFIADTGSLTSLLVAARLLQTRAGVLPAETYLMDSYPRSFLETRSLVRRAAQHGGHTAVLVSVGASGRLTSSIHRAALEELGDDPNAWTITQVVGRSGALNLDPRVETWLEYQESEVSAQHCEWCADPNRAAVVQIDPRSLGTVVIPRPSLIMPDVQSALASRDLWKHLDSARALQVQRTSDVQHRARGRAMALSADMQRFAASDGACDLVSNRVGRLTTQASPFHPALNVNRGPQLKEIADAEVILLVDGGDAAEAVALATHRAAATDHNAYEVPIVLRFKSGMDVPTAKHILIFALGYVSGYTMRQAFLELVDNENRPGRISGLVVHARPVAYSDWLATYNTFEFRLFHLWFTALPLSSPLRREAQVLAAINGLTGQANTFVDTRLALLEVAEIDRLTDTEIFWSASLERPSVRGEAIYGTGLSELGALCAVGSAVQHARQIATISRPNEWVMFDIPKVIRSYYDAVLVCAILRWIEPGESSWGTDPADTMEHLLTITTDRGNQSMLVPELLLGVADGRIPRETLKVLMGVTLADETGALEVARAAISIPP